MNNNTINLSDLTQAQKEVILYDNGWQPQPDCKGYWNKQFTSKRTDEALNDCLFNEGKVSV